MWALTLWYAVLGITVAGFAALFVARSVRGATLEHRLLSVAIVANVAACLHDFYVIRGAAEYLHITMLVYSSILFDLTLGAILILRFRAANAQVGELMRSLAGRVAQRERELGDSYRQLEQLARRQERTAERSSILRDMHDGVGAHLSMALRQIESSGIRLHWNVEPLTPVERLDAQAMRQLMFILFEAISNVLQHSGASELRVEAREDGGSVQVQVVDNGVGFDVVSSSESGLLNLKSRAERIGARLEIQSVPGCTLVELMIPRR